MKKFSEVEGYKNPTVKGFSIPIWWDEELGGYRTLDVTYEESYNFHNLHCYMVHYLKKIIRKCRTLL